MMAMIGSSINGQYTTVVFNYEKSFFNEGEPLPAEKKFIVTGSMDSKIEMVELMIFRPNGKYENPLYVSAWKRPFDNTSSTFYIPVEYVLRSNDKYELSVSYYTPLSVSEKQNLQENLITKIKTYLLQSLEVTNKKISFTKPYQAIRKDLDEIVTEGIRYYRSFAEIEFEGFSDVVIGKLRQFDQINLKKVYTNGENNAMTDKQLAAEAHIENLIGLISSEVDHYLNHRMLILNDSKRIPLYPTEKLINVISANLGYGGVYLGGNLQNLSYGNGPYAGVSFPLGKKIFNSTFMSNTSLSIGLFLTDFEDENENLITGPIIKKPIYAGLGYKFLDFMRINAGAVLLEESADTQSNFSVGDLSIQPFIGISLEINLWLGIGRK